MAIKDLAVCYNGSDNADAALNYAVQMSSKYGATLTGVYINSPVHLDGRVEHWMTDDLRRSMKAASLSKRSLAANASTVVAPGTLSGVDLTSSEA